MVIGLGSGWYCKRTRLDAAGISKSTFSSIVTRGRIIVLKIKLNDVVVLRADRNFSRRERHVRV